MQWLLKNLIVAAAVAGLISMGGSLAFAHGGGGHGGGGHSSSGRNSSHSGQIAHNHVSQSHKFNKINPKGHGRVVSNKGEHRGRRGRHRRPRYHMYYPVRFWFDGGVDGNSDDVDAAESGIDVEFTSIRQLDAGDPAKNLAPAYRVWFHNNSTVDIDTPFDVAILASTDGKLAQDLPFASVRVDALAADETMSVDIRLPIEAMNMGGDGQKAEYSFLHTIIDSQRELEETNKANNLAVFARTDIPALGANAADNAGGDTADNADANVAE